MKQEKIELQIYAAVATLSPILLAVIPKIIVDVSDLIGEYTK
jgi:hypothetical protein